MFLLRRKRKSTKLYDLLNAYSPRARSEPEGEKIRIFTLFIRVASPSAWCVSTFTATHNFATFHHPSSILVLSCTQGQGGRLLQHIPAVTGRRQGYIPDVAGPHRKTNNPHTPSDNSEFLVCVTSTFLGLLDEGGVSRKKKTHAYCCRLVDRQLIMQWILGRRIWLVI